MSTIDSEDLSKVEHIRTVFSYAKRFREQLFVIHVADTLIEDSIIVRLMQDLVALMSMGIRIIIIPGAASNIDRILASQRIDTQSVDGIRVTPSDAIPFIKMASFDTSSKVMTQLATGKVQAVIGNWVKARNVGVRDGVDFQQTGEVDSVRIDLLHRMIDEDIVPIVPCIGWSMNGLPYNICTKQLALALSQSMGASKLVFLTDQRLISSSEYDIPESCADQTEIRQMTIHEARQFLQLNTEGPLVEYLRYACEALESSVDRAHILDGRSDGIVLLEIFSSAGGGTMIYIDKYRSIRSARSSDVSSILRLMAPLVQKKLLRKKDKEEILRDLSSYVVYDIDGEVEGCCGLQLYANGSAEIMSLAVSEIYIDRGVGRNMVEFLIQRARERSIKRLFALTTHATDWFRTLGFRPASSKDLPPERRNHYQLSSRKSRILLLQLDQPSCVDGAVIA